MEIAENMDMEKRAVFTHDGMRIHFAVMAIESGARLLGVDNREMYRRLKEHNLIQNRLLKRYETLHTQSREWVAEDIVETLKNRETGI